MTPQFLLDVLSLKKIFNLLAQFESCSGLRINGSIPVSGKPVSFNNLYTRLQTSSTIDAIVLDLKRVSFKRHSFRQTRLVSRQSRLVWDNRDSLKQTRLVSNKRDSFRTNETRFGQTRLVRTNETRSFGFSDFQTNEETRLERSGKKEAGSRETKKWREEEGQLDDKKHIFAIFALFCVRDRANTIPQGGWYSHI